MTAAAYAAPPEPAEIIVDMDEDGYMNSEARSNSRRKRQRRRRHHSNSSESSISSGGSRNSDEEEDADEADESSSDCNTSGSEWPIPQSLRPKAIKRKKQPVNKNVARRQLAAKKRKDAAAALCTAADPEYGVPINPADDPNYRPFLGEENADWRYDAGHDGRLRVEELLDSSESDPCTESDDDFVFKSTEQGPSTRIGSNCKECRGRRIPHLEFEASADGVTMQKKAIKDQCWPLMGQLISVSPCIHVKDTVKFFLPRNSKPFIIGFYHGAGKPGCVNEYLASIFKEMELAEKHRLCTSFLKFFIADGPGRQLVKGFPSHSAYCGCERYFDSAVLS
jgi:hypothetical protein